MFSDYHNPNDYWQHNPMMQDPNIDPDDAMKSGCFVLVFYIVAFIVGVVLCALLGSCTTTKYVPVVETRDHHHWHTDSICKTDSVYHEKTTTIMQLDSAAMARYGIRLKDAERAWLVKTAELERQLQQLERLTADRDTIHDSIPVPYPVIKEVEKQLTRRQQMVMCIGLFAIIVAACWFVWWAMKILRRFDILRI